MGKSLSLKRNDCVLPLSEPYELWHSVHGHAFMQMKQRTHMSLLYTTEPGAEHDIEYVVGTSDFGGGIKTAESPPPLGSVAESSQTVAMATAARSDDAVAA